MNSSTWARRRFIKTVVIGSAGIGATCEWSGRPIALESGAGPRAEVRSESFAQCHGVRDGVSLPVAKPSRDVDVVVIAGGLSGLTAAYRLRNHNVLVLEKEPHVGGNAHTDTWEGIQYPTGASFTHSASSPMALYDEIGLTVMRRVAGAGTGAAIGCYNGQKISDLWGEGFKRVHPEAAGSLDEFKNDMRAIDVEGQKSRLDAIVFRDMLKSYNPAVIKWFDLHGEWLGGSSPEISGYAGVLFTRMFLGEGLGILLSQKRYDPDYYQFVGGLGAASEALARKIEESGSNRIELNATAYRVANTEDGHVLASYMRAGKPVTVRARACIVAAPKLIAGRMVADLPTEQKQAMLAFRYIAYTVVLAGFPKQVITDPAARMLDAPLIGTWSFADIGHNAARDPKQKSAVRAILPLGGEFRPKLLSDDGARDIAHQFADYLERYYPGSRERILEMRVHRRGHNWYTPVPYFTTRLQPIAAQPFGRVAFAHSDSVGIISDSDWAVIAADRAVGQVHDMLSRSSSSKRVPRRNQATISPSSA